MQNSLVILRARFALSIIDSFDCFPFDSSQSFTILRKNDRKTFTMVRLSPTTSPSLFNRCLSTTQSHVLLRFAFIFTLIVFWWSHQKKERLFHSSGDVQVATAASSSSRSESPLDMCLDPDDPEEWILLTPATCQCLDPLTPARRYNEPVWDAQHQRLVRTATTGIPPPNHNSSKNTTTARSARDNKPSLVWIGDSIVERWNGTRGMGARPYPEYRQVFDAYFCSETAPFAGLALGTSGDTGVELLWHLQNGMLPDTLQPDLWVIVIGTNDLGRWDCSKRTAAAAILNVAEYLHAARPDAAVVIHGLLPRSDYFGEDPVDYSLGRRWDQILWINRELKRFCSLHDKWVYLESSRLFLRKKVEDGTDTQGELEILPDTMEDALHPSVEGYRQWGEYMVKRLEKVLLRNEP